MKNRALHRTVTLAVTLSFVAASHAAIAVAADDPPPAVCDALAAEYDRQADAYEAGAERYRTWAAAEGMFRSDGAATELEFMSQAERLAAAARQSRARAVESRRAAGVASQSASNGCDVPTASSRS